MTTAETTASTLTAARPLHVRGNADPGPGASAAGTPGGKGEQTRATIIDVALRLFRERGYEATTMRAIAAEAGVSLGNAYYYFGSKEHLIQGYYERIGVDHAAAAAGVLDGERDLERRIVAVLDAWVDLIQPYRSFAGQFFTHAAQPTSPLSPFSAESGPAREAAIGLWRDVIDGSDSKIAKGIADELPELLWLYFMGLVLFWVHDPSDDNARTRLLAARTAPLVVRAIGLARVPVIKATIEDLIGLIGELKTL
jgi:AcrR family transcriptional regulator